MAIVGTLKDSTNIMNPVITLSYNAAILSKNYAYIPAFNRYYYFSEPPTIEGDTIIINLHADSLYNFRDIIRMSDCIAERSGSDFNLNIPDSAVIEESGYYYTSGVLSYTFRPDNGQYILTVSGGD